MTIVRTRQAQVQKGRKSEAPLTVVWNSAPMIRIHSLKRAVEEIINMSDSLDVVKINIVGNPSTGKSELAKTIAHLIHKQAKIPFAVRLFGREDLARFSDVLKSLESTNHVLIFDDVSFLKADMSNRQISNLEKEFTMIRHLPGGQDVKIIALFNSHYTVAISKYLRQSDFHFYTTVGTSDIDHLGKLIGHKYMPKISRFQQTSIAAVKQHKFSYVLSAKKKTKFTYEYRKPFAPVLFFNGMSAREVMFPLRTWIDKFCMTCESSHEDVTTAQTLEKFDEMAQSKFGPRTITQALRLIASLNGIYTQRRRVRQCMTFIEKFQAENQVSLPDMLKFYEMENLKTRLILTDEMKEGMSDGLGPDDPPSSPAGAAPETATAGTAGARAPIMPPSEAP